VTRLRKELAAVSLAALLAVAAGAAAPPRTGVAVYFLQGEQLVRVARTGATLAAALRQLVKGPTPAEVKRGVRTFVPSGTEVHSVSVVAELATVDLNRRFIAGRDPQSLLARLSQVVRTLTGVQGVTKVQLLIDGVPVSGVFPGISTASPLTFRYLQTPNVPVPQPPQLRLPAPDAHIRKVQRRLIALRYLIHGDADGRLGPATKNAILAFQKWERLDRTGVLDARTESRLKIASPPAPFSSGGTGRRAEILLDRQMALLIENDEVLRAIAVSTGKPSTPTPPGSYRVYAKITRWWSTPFREWLPWALPFVGGIAFHEFPDVPAYPASHGCVRQSFAVARWTYDFAEVGMPVKVIGRS
jgi:hypothetical protein